MRTMALLATLTFVAIAFAGCSSDGDGDGDPSSSSSSTSRTSTSSTGTSTSQSATSTTGSSSTTSTGPSNRPPSGSISVAVNGTNATFSLTGSDPDGDTLVWDLTFGDGASSNGTGLPANRTHTYAAAGNFTANFTVTDGTSPVAYAVNLTIAPSGGGTLAVFAEATTVPGNPANSVVVPPGLGIGANGCAGYTADMSGEDCVFFELTPDLAGHPFTGTASAGDPDLEFWDICDPALGAFMENYYATGPEAGVVPEGTACVILWMKTPPTTGTLTFTVLA